MNAYAIHPRPVLGPCACQDCGEPLYWARRNTTVLHVIVGSLRWRDWNGRIHKCAGTGRQRRYNGRLKEGRYPQLSLARARAQGYNGATGSSGESNTIADGTRVLATTRDAGVIAFRGSSS